MTILKHSTHQSLKVRQQKTNSKIPSPFYPLTQGYSQKMRNSQLTAAEWRIWSYLVGLDPTGDRYEPLPDILTIMQAVVRSLCGHADAASSATCNIQLDNDIPFF